MRTHYMGQRFMNKYVLNTKIQQTFTECLRARHRAGVWGMPGGVALAPKEKDNHISDIL